MNRQVTLKWMTPRKDVIAAMAQVLRDHDDHDIEAMWSIAQQYIKMTFQGGADHTDAQNTLTRAQARFNAALRAALNR